jgi:predicted transcriptional regulator
VCFSGFNKGQYQKTDMLGVRVRALYKSSVTTQRIVRSITGLPCGCFLRLWAFGFARRSFYYNVSQVLNAVSVICGYTFGCYVGDGMGDHRRGEVEIMRDVLEVCLSGANKTKIVYSANLNFSRAEKFLGMLESLGFLVGENVPGRSLVYRTTEAGVSFLDGCLKMENSLTDTSVKKR